MNNQRRKALEELRERLSVIRGEIACVAEEERESFDNLPEGLQYSERGEAMGTAADTLEEIECEIEEIEERIGEAAE